MKIFPISGYKYGVPEKIGMGLKAKFERFRREIYEKNSGKEFKPEPTGQMDADGEEIWYDMDYERWMNVHINDYEVQLGMAELYLEPQPGAPPVREIFAEADEKEVVAALSFFGNVLQGILDEHGITTLDSEPKTPSSKKGTRKAKTAST